MRFGYWPGFQTTAAANTGFFMPPTQQTPNPLVPVAKKRRENILFQFVVVGSKLTQFTLIIFFALALLCRLQGGRAGRDARGGAAVRAGAGGGHGRAGGAGDGGGGPGRREVPRVRMDLPPKFWTGGGGAHRTRHGDGKLEARAGGTHACWSAGCPPTRLAATATCSTAGILIHPDLMK